MPCGCSRRGAVTVKMTLRSPLEGGLHQVETQLKSGKPAAAQDVQSVERAGWSAVRMWRRTSGSLRWVQAAFMAMRISSIHLTGMMPVVRGLFVIGAPFGSYRISIGDGVPGGTPRPPHPLPAMVGWGGSTAARGRGPFTGPTSSSTETVRAASPRSRGVAGPGLIGAGRRGRRVPPGWDQSRDQRDVRLARL